LNSHFVFVVWDLNIDSQFFCCGELINIAEFRFDFVILADDIDDLFDIQTLDQVLSDYERSTNHNIVDILAAESHQKSF